MMLDTMQKKKKNEFQLKVVFNVKNRSSTLKSNNVTPNGSMQVVRSCLACGNTVHR
ncbi:unnamed protein product [Ixodes pacificus]